MLCRPKDQNNLSLFSSEKDYYTNFIPDKTTFFSCAACWVLMK